MLILLPVLEDHVAQDHISAFKGNKEGASPMAGQKNKTFGLDWAGK